MLERLVEHWLTSVGELGYQVPFTQMLMLEGHTVLQGPVHHMFEHGKDLITVDADGRLCAFQLKGPREITHLDGLEKYQGQLDALAMTAISHSSLGSPRLADKIAVVTNGELRPEVRDRLNHISIGFQLRRLPPLEYIERDHLLTRLLAVHGRFLPREPKSFRKLVNLYSDQGQGLLPVDEFLGFIEELLPFTDDVGPTEARRALASAALMSAYALRGWEAEQNHLAVAQGWLLFAMATLRLAEEKALKPVVWESSFDLAMQSVRTALTALLEDALSRDDLVEPDLTEPAFYGSRALLVCGWASALLMSEQIIGTASPIRSLVQQLLRREVKFARVLGESGAPLLFAIANALSLLENSFFGEHFVIEYCRGLIQRNQSGGVDPLPDPYHGIEDLLMRSLGFEVENPLERFDGHVYTSHVAIEWLARRLRRQAVAAMWTNYTRLTTVEFRTSRPTMVLSGDDADGRLHMVVPSQPGSWYGLRREALLLRPRLLPRLVLDKPEILPYIPLLLPQRFTADLVRYWDFFLFPTSDFVVSTSEV